MSRAVTPPFVLLFMALCLLGMFAASFQSFLRPPVPAAPAQRGSAATTADEPSSPAEGDISLALTEQQADTLSELMRKIQADPQDAEALTRIGESFLMAKDWVRSGAFLSRAIVAAPKDIRPRYMMGISLYQQERMPEAALVFQDLLAIKKDPAAQYNLAVIYKYHLNREAEAETLLRDIVSSGTADVDTIGRAKKELAAE